MKNRKILTSILLILSIGLMFGVVSAQENCTDSDGGKNYFVKGDVYSIVGPQAPESGEDSCMTEDFQYEGYIGAKLSEVYCTEDGRYAHEVVDCEFGCKDGACLTKDYIEPNSVTNIHNILETPQTCAQICAQYNSSVAKNGCIDSEYKKCTILSGNTCLEGVDEETYLINNDYATSCCCENVKVNGCVSMDGVNPFRKGTTKDKDGNKQTDECSENLVLDYHCDAWGQAVTFNDLVCPNGCEDGACIPCNGCISNQQCFTFGTRQDNLFCSQLKSEFIAQFEEGITCSDNFECKDNICIDGKCVGISIWQKFLDWFARIFGKE